MPTTSIWRGVWQPCPRPRSGEGFGSHGGSLPSYLPSPDLARGAWAGASPATMATSIPSPAPCASTRGSSPHSDAPCSSLRREKGESCDLGFLQGDRIVMTSLLLEPSHHRGPTTYRDLDLHMGCRRRQCDAAPAAGPSADELANALDAQLG